MRLVVEPWARHLTLPPLRAAMIDLEGPETVSMRWKVPRGAWPSTAGKGRSCL